MSVKLSDIKRHSSIPVRSGVGLRAENIDDICDKKPSIPWLETHSENYFLKGGVYLDQIIEISDYYPISFHGVGLSLGSVEGVSKVHLKHLRELFDKVPPVFVSDHVSWSVFGGYYYNDLFPLPYNQESLKVMSQNIMKVQEYLGRQILIENPSSYIEFNNTDMPEWEFLFNLQQNTACGILFDVNNIYVSAINSGQDPHCYLKHIKELDIQEIHLAGYLEENMANGRVLIDNHGSKVKKEVWELYESVIDIMGPVPTMIEWDDDVPELNVLLEEAEKADCILQKYSINDVAI